jgi:hypothetical protein
MVCNRWTLSGPPWLQPGGHAEQLAVHEQVVGWDVRPAATEQAPPLAGTRAAGHRQTDGRLLIDERARVGLSSARLCHSRREDDGRGRAGDEIALAQIAAARKQRASPFS